MKRLGAILFAISLTVFAVSCGPKPAETPTPTAVPEPVVEAEPTAPAEPAGPCIVKDGVSEYRVVLSPDASPSEKKAAMELAAYINTCTGAELPVVEAAGDADPTGAPMLVVGFGPAATALGVDASDYDLGEQGYVLKTADANVVIAGTPAAGTLYGVMDFLESQVGVRWHAPGATKTPKLEQLPLPQLDAVVKPAFEMRDTTYAWPGGDAAFRAQQRENAGGAGPDGEWGVQHAHHGRCHTYFSYISPGAYFDEHPEYFSEIGGVRQREETQLCLTNPEVLDIVTEKMLANMEAKPNYRQYNFSQMDWYSVCECEKCRAMNDQYAADGGTQYWFCNQLAERTSKVYPDKLIGTLAYMYTEEAPKGLEIHPNVAVWLCHMFPCCDSHPIATCELNADYKRRAQEWSKLCSHLYIWHYVVDFAHYYNPFPNFRAMAADMKFYRDIGVEGMFLQGMGHPGGGGEFSLLRPYLGMKLLWNPDQDPEVIIKDFLEGYYGAGWEPIWQYITMVHDKVENENIHMHLYTNPSQGYMPDEVLAKARELFDQAEAVVDGNEDLLDRIRVARMPLSYARIFPRNGYKIENGKMAFQGDVAPIEETQAFIGLMKEKGFATIREMGGDPNELMMWSMAGNNPLDVPTIKNEFLTVDMALFVGGRVLRITDNKTGECVTANNTTRCLYFPFCGGDEIRLGGTTFISGLAGNMEVYVPAGEATETEFAMETATGGFKVRRTVSLAPDKPVLTITTEATNTTDKPRKSRLRSHLELDMGPLRETKVNFTDRTGQEVAPSMEAILANLREGEHYYDEAAPKGEWTFTGTEGLKLVQRFDDASVNQTWIYAYPDYLNDLEVEVWGQETVVEPGKSMVFSHSLEVLPIAE